MNHMDSINKKSLPAELLLLLPDALSQQCIWLSCHKGMQLFPQGRKPEHMFYVSSGEVVLQRTGMQGEIIVLQRARQSFVAEASVQSLSYHCDAVVTIAGELIAVPIELFRQVLLSDQAFAMRWMAMLNRELKRLRAQCARLSLKGVRARLLHLIESEGEQGRLPLGTGLKSIALELGVSHEALYRTVSELEKQGVLQREEGLLTLI
jgi:CRP-like cAMP-binding protein